MLAYPIHLEPDDNDTLLATSPDFPELVTFGDDRDDALTHAVDALEEAIAVRMRYEEDIPPPSQGADCAILPALTEAKVLLYQGMREQGIGKDELAYQLIVRLSSEVDVDLVLQIQHSCQIDVMDAALQVVGRRLTVVPLSD